MNFFNGFEALKSLFLVDNFFLIIPLLSPFSVFSPADSFNEKQCVPGVTDNLQV